jgi:hypothetical protein
MKPNGAVPNHVTISPTAISHTKANDLVRGFAKMTQKNQQKQQNNKKSIKITREWPTKIYSDHIAFYQRAGKRFRGGMKRTQEVKECGINNVFGVSMTNHWH